MKNAKIAVLVGGFDLFSGFRGISKGTRIIEKAIRPIFDQVIAVNYNYFLDFGRTHNQLTEMIRKQYPAAELMFYGYSKGGDVVLKLSRSMKDTHVILLLITVDIANGPWSAKINRSVPGNVKKNINVYQTKPRPPLFSYGMPAYSNYPVTIENIELTQKIIRNQVVNHSNIENLMVD